MMRRFLLLSLVVAALLLFGVGVAAAAISQPSNPSFATGDFAGWTVVGANTIVEVGGSDGDGYHAKMRDGWISQTFVIDSTGCDFIVIHFDVRVQASFAKVAWIRAGWDSAEIRWGAIYIENAPDLDWHSYEFVVIPNGASTVFDLRFEDIDNSSGAHWDLDNIRVLCDPTGGSVGGSSPIDVTFPGLIDVNIISVEPTAYSGAEVAIVALLLLFGMFGCGLLVLIFFRTR